MNISSSTGSIPKLIALGNPFVLSLVRTDRKNGAKWLDTIRLLARSLEPMKAAGHLFIAALILAEALALSAMWHFNAGEQVRYKTSRCKGVSSLSKGVKVSLYASASIAALHPKLVCHDKRIDLTLGPPISLIACRMVLAVVDRAKWNGKFVTHLEAKTPLLSVADVVGMRRSTAADETGLLCDMA